MKILFPTNSWLYDVMIRSFPVWKKMGVDIIYDLLCLPHLTALKKYLGDYLVDYSVYPSSIYDIWFSIDITDENILRLEKKYQVVLNEMIIYDLAMVKYKVIPPQKIRDEIYWRKLFVATFDYYEKLLNKHKPDYIFGEGPHGLGMKVLFEVSKKMDIPFFSISGSYFKDKAIFSYGRTGENLILKKCFENEAFLNKQDFKKGEEFILSVRHKREIPYYQVKFHKQKTKLFPTNCKIGLKALYKLIKIYKMGRLLSALDYSYNPFWSPIFNRIPTYIKYKYISKVALLPDYKQNYIVYFNHYQPEATTSCVAPFYENQDNLLENIGKSTSGAMRFYVKEHTTNLGNRGKEFYSNLRNYTNVQLINPFASSFELIEKSHMVLTISGTVGLEAIIMGKPVGVFSDCYYSFYPGVRRITEPEQIKNVINWGLYEFKKDEAAIKRFAAAYCKSLYPTFFSEKDGDILGSELERFVEGILLFIDDYKNITSGARKN